MKTQLKISYEEIISLENLFTAWQEFLPGKKKKQDVQEFGVWLTDNILQLHDDLANFSYVHGSYKAFNISDPKPRNIHKATVRDRVLHHAIYRKLYPFFEKVFIADSYSCQIGKGTHKALSRFKKFYQQASKNNRRTVWVLKCDIRKFFASIDHKILLKILASYIPDENILWLLGQVIKSFHFGADNKGLPLGNLTSQLFCNVYMNKFDQFVKHRLKVKYYVRYADDFVFLSYSRDALLTLVPKIATFLDERLKLSLHPDKIFIKTLASGVDFLGWVNFPHHRVMRNVTKKRMFRGLKKRPKNPTLQSYLGLISHGNTFKLKQEVLNWYGLWIGDGI
ncbi:MAG: reverse transcriptase/maturase family protein [Patescibacteria group bacterium]|nr:reverse transcriptase/maturase family protein [Patescibacteria group bacterium]